MLRSAPTVGVLAAWHVYEGTTIDGYLHDLLEGVSAAARDQACNLLLACGVAPPPPPRLMTPAWPRLMSDAQFVPVGPWNTDGLIVVPDTLSAERLTYVQSIMADGQPIVFAGAPELQPSVAADNASGIRQAVEHLIAHGHRHIAFIPNAINRPGDSLERMHAYQETLQQHGLPIDPRLIAHGDHTDDTDSGRQAMQRILASGAPCSAAIAFNDWFAIGALEAVKSAGRAVPRDFALIGFDDRLHARVQTPPLSTVRHPTFELGYQTFVSLLQLLDGSWDGRTTIRIPMQLVIRQSCGCRPGVALQPERVAIAPAVPLTAAVLAQSMAAAAATEAHHFRRDELYAMSKELAAALLDSVEHGAAASFTHALEQLLVRTEVQNEEAYIWHAAILALQQTVRSAPAASALLTTLLDQAQVAVGERARRQTTRALIRQMEAADRLGLMTAQLLAALDTGKIADILAVNLPRVGIRHAFAARYEAEEDDAVALSRRVLGGDLSRALVDRAFTTRHFPAPGFYPDDRPIQLAILPLIIQAEVIGFIAFEAANLEPCAVIMRNVAAALRSSQLYHAAAEGQRLAEEANRLKTRFLSTVSHELRTPLNVIVGLSELLLREQAQGHAPPAQDLERIFASAQHLGFLIRDVLDLASNDAGQLRLSGESLDLIEVLRTVIVTGEQLARDKGLTWQAQLPDRVPTVWGDRTRLRQVALNFISNAVKFTPRGTVQLMVEVAEEHITVSVSDTGLGIPLSEQESIFDEFHQSERTAARGFGGLGLGLAISRHLIELHGGTIGARSSGVEGEGATFFFTLPIMREPIAPAEPLTWRDHPAVLLLTDRAEGADRVETYLRQQGFEVVTRIITTEAEVTAAIRDELPATVLVSRSLLEGRGWNMVRQLKDQPQTQDASIVFYDLPHAGASGAVLDFDYQLKPLQAQQLARVLKPSPDTSTILIVDDDAAVLDLHTRLVQKQLPLCCVLTARNGREALAVVHETRPDLILLDLMMPELDGFGVLEALRASEATRSIPVIVLTAQALTADDMARLNQTVVAVLEKGVFSAEETLAHVTAALARADKASSAAQRLVRKAMAYLHAHYAEAVSREQVARDAHVSENYLTNCFHHELGISPMTYLARYRVTQARTLLETSQLNITEVALAVGFSDGAYFSRVFQREMGVSPGAYRRGRRAP
jgi:signal transduction histidine kinase/DNA-binding LacI/PurR family transcriptional regulator/DNA-binding response OmpR family regulator